MSARERAGRHTKAVVEGRIAHDQGLTKAQCPYKVSNWGLGASWLLGWSQANQLNEETTVATKKRETVASIQARTDLDAKAARLHQAKLEPTKVTGTKPDPNREYMVLEFQHAAGLSKAIKVLVYILPAFATFVGFGGSRGGLMVGQTPSLIIRTIHPGWGVRDGEYAVTDPEAWAAIREGINLSYVEHFRCDE